MYTINSLQAPYEEMQVQDLLLGTVSFHMITSKELIYFHFPVWFQVTHHHLLLSDILAVCLIKLN